MSQKKGVVMAKKTNKKIKKVGWEEMDRFERISEVCNHFCKGLKMTEISKKISKDFGINLSREAIYPIILDAAKNGFIGFVPEISYTQEERIKKQYNYLEDIKVVHTTKFEDVAYHGAKMLLNMVQSYRDKKEEVHIGFAGGHSMRKLAQIFAELLRNADKLPSKMILHAMVAGWDVFEPTTAPTTFFTLFHNMPLIETEISFVGLYTPAIVEANDFIKLKSSDGVKESYDEADKIDIIVTSATNWSDEHSTFRKYMIKSPDDCFDKLQSEDCLGDILWLPIDSEKPIINKTKTRAMTLMELSEIPDFIKDDRKVLLVMGPCAYCNRTKSEILSAILNQKKHIITHLAVDTRSVREIL